MIFVVVDTINPDILFPCNFLQFLPGAFADVSKPAERCNPASTSWINPGLFYRAAVVGQRLPGLYPYQVSHFIHIFLKSKVFPIH